MHIILLLLYCLLFVCTSSFAVTGPETAQLLNRRYQSTVAECVGNNPAYFCSGVLLLVRQHADAFWMHGADATESGAESLTYVRSDLGTRSVAPNGVVFADSFTAIGAGKTLEMLCAYPFEFPLPGTRPAFGCGMPSAAAQQDVSACAALGITDAPGWIAHFQEQDQQPDRQCSLSTAVPAQFTASLIAHQGLSAEWSAKPNLLQLKNWDANAPKQLPIQALFYDSTQTGALLGAQKDQRDYFMATDDWLPILRMDLNQGPDRVFGFDQQDQLYIGYQVASRLNARYEDTSLTCKDGRTAYYCNGVLLRSTQASTAFHMWNPSPGSVKNNGVSFSYLRADAKLSKLVYAQGFIIRESAAPTAYPLTLMCMYPFDGATGGSLDTCKVRGPLCDETGVTSVAEWSGRYAARPRSSCAFNVNPEQFQVNIDVRPTAPSSDGWNEAMIQTWPQDIPLRIAMEAFYYNLDAHFPSQGLPQAQFAQRDYLQVTGRFLPIVFIDLKATDGRTFIYKPEDQLAPGTPIQFNVRESDQTYRPTPTKP